MIKIRVVRGIQKGFPLASGIVALSGGFSACAAPPASEDVSADESAFTVADPGTGVFELGWTAGTPTGQTFNAKNSTDEYVRALEKMTFSIPALFLWSQLHPSEQPPSDPARLKQLSANVNVTYYKNGAPFEQAVVKTNGWSGEVSSQLKATTDSFTVSKRAQEMRFAVEIVDNGVNPPVSKRLPEGSFFDQPVIGGSVPDKTLLFDHIGQALRDRVLEGGLPVQGADLAIAYTDWRASKFMDTSSIDRQIGTQQSFSRFGGTEIPIYGEIEYDIAYDYAIDGVWQEREQTLAPNRKSRLMPPNGRTAYEGSINVPAGGQNVSIYFHVKAILKADYSQFSNIRSKRYADGARVLVREKFDNENGVASDAYDFRTETNQ